MQPDLPALPRHAGPHRTEEMSRETLADVVAFIAISSIRNSTSPAERRS